MALSLSQRIRQFIHSIDDDQMFINVPLEEVLEQVALTPKEKKVAKQLMEECNETESREVQADDTILSPCFARQSRRSNS